MFEVIGDAGAYVTAAGLPPQRPLRGNGSGTYACADGAYVQFNPIGATRRFVTWFLHAAGHPEWSVDGDDDELGARLTALFATRTAAEWEELGHAAGVPLARVRTSQEWLHTPHAVESGAVVRLDDPGLGETLVPGPAVRSGDVGAAPSAPPSAHTVGPRRTTRLLPAPGASRSTASASWTSPRSSRGRAAGGSSASSARPSPRSTLRSGGSSRTAW
jgi:crotonobetainyl-CoA:carnitine CoA-transferase CaiB-like acyl-CoA transferase